MKKIIQYFFSRPLFVATLSCSFIILFILLSLKPKAYLKSEQDIESYINNWNYEITHALFYKEVEDKSVKNKIEYVKKLLDPLKFYPLSYYEITIDQKPVLAWTSHKEKEPQSPSKKILSPPSNCHEVGVILTLKGGLPVGRFKACLSDSKVLSATVFSSKFSFFVFIIFLMIALIPLLNYKKSLNASIKTLKNWRRNPKNNLSIDIQDDISKEFMTLTRQCIEANNELIHLNTDLEYQKSISEIINHAAHDIRKPVDITQRKLLLNKDLSETKKNDLLLSTFDLILKVSSDLMDRDKINKFRKNKVFNSDVTERIKKLVNYKKELYPQIKFSVTIPKSLKILCSPNELERVISNLISNAVDAIGEKKGEIQVQCKEFDNKTWIEVSDNGCGVNPDHLSHIFEQGFSTKNSNGMGLYYIRKKVKEWGGNLNVDSQINVGTTFRIECIKKSVKLQSLNPIENQTNPTLKRSV